MTKLAFAGPLKTKAKLQAIKFLCRLLLKIKCQNVFEYFKVLFIKLLLLMPCYYLCCQNGAEKGEVLIFTTPPPQKNEDHI